VMLSVFLNSIGILFRAAEEKITYIRVITRRELGLHAKALGTQPQPSAVLLFLLANEARTKQGECRALVVKGHMSNLWHWLRPLPAAPLVVRRRYLVEVLSPLPTIPLVMRRTMLWPLRRCALRVLNRDAQADARPAVRAHAFTVISMPLEKSLWRAPTPYEDRWQRESVSLIICSARGLT
jgi:hypothetical protein